MLAADPASSVRPLAEALSWLWRLGPVADRVTAQTVGIGDAGEAEELSARVRGGEAVGAIVLAPEPGPELGPLPARRRVAEVARFAPGARVFDEHTIFAGGQPVVRTRVGIHATLVGEGVLAVGADLVGRWGRLGAFWALGPIGDFVVERTGRKLLRLAPVGVLRLDDAPGTAQMQLEGRAKDDRVATRRIERLVATYRDHGARLNVAVAARALLDGEPVPLEEVWPRGVAALRDGVAQGVLEPVCHGWLHYDSAATTEERVEPREFLNLDEAEAGRRLDAAIAWQAEQLGPPRTFVAPAWGYSRGTLAAAAQRSLPAWHRAAPEPLLVDGNPRETLIGAGGPGGVHRLDYGSLVRLAQAGVPPTLALHGGLIDDRLTSRVARDAFAYARLLRRRDAHRLPAVGGLRWIGAGELVERLEAHAASEVRG